SSLRFNIFSGKEKTYQAWCGVPEDMLNTNRTYNPAGTEKNGTPYTNQTDNYTQKHYQLFYNHTINNSWSYNIAGFYTKGFGYYENYKADEKYTDYGVTNSLVSKTDLIRQQWLDNDFYGSIFSIQYKTIKNTVTIGGSLTNYKGNHNGQVIWAAKGGFEPNQKYYDVDASKWERSFYTKWQHNINPNFSLYVDAQYRFVEHDMKGFKYNPTLYVNRKFSFINPKLGVSYTRNNWQTFISYAMASKEPNRDDFEAGLINQPKEEQLHDFELGISKKTKNYNFGLTAYYMLYKDQLVLTGKINDVGAYTRTNVDNSYRAGVELEGSYVFKKWLNVNANLTLSKNKVKEFTEYADDYDNGGQKEIKHSNTDITLSPSIISSHSLNFLVCKDFSFNLIGKYVGKQYLDNTQDVSRSLNSYYTQDIKLNYYLKNKWFKETTLMLSVNNIFSTKYVASGYCYSYIYGGSFTTDKFYFPQAGINYMFSLNVKL
ncbi:MAG: outer membrane beta-barrel protein, partial [Bacteroidetes bacterium]|nr:outer membrane beta-barrel protein [Bacteroidota bacterium]